MAKKKQRDLASLPAWAQDYISKLHALTNNVVCCRSCGDIHLDGYVCWCGHDSTYKEKKTVEPLVIDENIGGW